ncbi:uncharacterized protein LOC143346065 [Colletes latitarsis]|uniref:uncharacterized protein LOC143346065 n=1 Tax=Colletes latitarsis TaxID=2605962 RepID=UPI00403673DF
MKTTLILASCLALLATANSISEQCKLYDKTRVACRCTGNEELFLSKKYDYKNVTNLQISSCRSANLHLTSIIGADQITEIIVQNISESLVFELAVPSKTMKLLKLSNIRRIPLIAHDTFLHPNSIDTLRIENTRIDRFEEPFAHIAINDFSMINVTIGHIDWLNFFEKSNTLHIENSVFQNVTGSLNFSYFTKVWILSSTFQLQKPGHLLIEGVQIFIKDCVFSNASVNVVATISIQIHDTCADGKSSMRLSSNRIESMGNRLPTEIVYTKRDRVTNRFPNQNNTICIAGDCKCPKSSARSTQNAAIFILLTFAFKFLLLLTVQSSTIS